MSEAKARGMYKSNFDSLEQIRRENIGVDPEEYVKLGSFYEQQRKYPQAEEAFKKAIEINPKDEEAYFGLGRCYLHQLKLIQAETAFKRAIELNPNNEEIYISGLGWFYEDQEKYPQAEEIFKKAIGINPKNDKAYVALGRCYLYQNKYSQAEMAFKKAIELNPQNKEAYAGLAILYGEIGELEPEEKYYKKADRIRSKYYYLLLRNNYRKLKSILDKRGIKLICVQYPMINVEVLKKIFSREQKNIIFVDNEKIFKDAVRKEGFKAYFVDLLGGNTGHCTRRGNRLLAENIANIILRKHFNR